MTDPLSIAKLKESQHYKRAVIKMLYRAMRYEWLCTVHERRMFQRIPYHGFIVPESGAKAAHITDALRELLKSDCVIDHGKGLWEIDPVTFAAYRARVAGGWEIDICASAAYRAPVDGETR